MVNSGQFYTLTDLQNALKEAGLPYSKPTLRSYEKKGIILQPKTKMSSWRAYTAEELKVNIDRITIYVAKHGRK